ncbi:c6 zinc finger domain containing protein [Grosmannia clavigera kw1407]|uniref:C6 zinc finger domain containing protein n=1 Tax=Grosmannia clavigera (strain kw1407 / UAMH 11150) TaxID=655863 RepID=F0XLK4_GROCL|nr:c6 zinc finger domain containing protein [Grosmannia clavigera kw1407]EFX01320.1 c6 zinc finger domain containing protein [Grosmannia clavigera kw1407]
MSLGCSSSSSFASPKSGPSDLSPRDLSWLQSAPPISPPMSSHDHPPLRQSSAASSLSSASGIVPGEQRSNPDGPSRLFGSDSGAHHPHQQLPSLSSLFGPPEAVQPLHASPPERAQAPTAALPFAAAGPSPPPPLSLDRQQPSPSSYYSKPLNLQAKTSRASPVLSQQPRYVYDSVRSADDRTSSSAYQQHQQQLPMPHQQDRQINEREPPAHASLQVSPRTQDKPGLLRQRESPPPSQPWSDSRPAYVTVGKWPRQEEGGSAYSQVREQPQPQQAPYRHHQHEHHGQPQHYHQLPLAENIRYAPLFPPGDRSPASEYERKLYRNQPPPAPPLPQPSPGSPYGGSAGSDYRAPMRSISGRSSSVSRNAPSTPDGVSVKDGLGPKIWTGTHFLPRFVRAAEVPGEGMCYFYDDGSHCKTVIDGEAVTAHWGVTKAGKPRKRLAIACVTCREKKIKCDPDYPRCVQCEKLGRVCKFKNAPRGGNNVSPSPSSVEPADGMRRATEPSRGLPVDSPWSFGYPGSMGSPRTTMMRPGSSDSRDAGSNKRIRTSFDGYASGRTRSPPLMARPLPHLMSSSASETALMPSEMGRGADLLPPLAWGSSSSSQQQPQLHSPPALSQQRYAPSSPPPADLPRIFLPPPRSHPDLPRKHNDMLMRPWQQDV